MRVKPVLNLLRQLFSNSDLTIAVDLVLFKPSAADRSRVESLLKFFL